MGCSPAITLINAVYNAHLQFFPDSFKPEMSVHMAIQTRLTVTKAIVLAKIALGEMQRLGVDELYVNLMELMIIDFELLRFGVAYHYTQAEMDAYASVFHVPGRDPEYENVKIALPILRNALDRTKDVRPLKTEFLPCGCLDREAYEDRLFPDGKLPDHMMG